MAIDISALERIKQGLEARSSRIAGQHQAATDFRLAQAVGTVPAGVGLQAADAVGAAAVAEQAKASQQVAGQTAALQQDLVKTAVQDRGLEAQQLLTGKERAYEAELRKQEIALAGLDQSYRDNLVDKQLKFNQDGRNRTLFSEHQLADWVASNARSEEELDNYRQQVSQLTERKLAFLQVAQAKLQQAMRQEQSKSAQEQDQVLRKELAETQARIAKQIENEKRKAANRGSMISGAMTVGGAVIGSMIAPGVGTAAGATIGQALSKPVAAKSGGTV